MLVTTHDDATGTPELVVFDTLVPQDHTKDFRQFKFPPKYSCWIPRTHTDPGSPLGRVTQDGPLTVDPTQAILAVELMGTVYNLDPRAFLVLRANTLIEFSCSMRAGPHIPWEEWGEGSVAIEILADLDHCFTFMHDTHMAVVVCVRGDVPEYRLHTFDFSKRGRHVLSLWDGEAGRTERRPVVGDGQKLTLEGGEDMSREDLLMLDDGTLVYLDQVGHLSHSVGDAVIG